MPSSTRGKLIIPQELKDRTRALFPHAEWLYHVLQETESANYYLRKACTEAGTAESEALLADWEELVMEPYSSIMAASRQTESQPA